MKTIIDDQTQYYYVFRCFPTPERGQVKHAIEQISRPTFYAPKGSLAEPHTFHNPIGLTKTIDMDLTPIEMIMIPSSLHKSRSRSLIWALTTLGGCHAPSALFFPLAPHGSITKIKGKL